MPNASSNEHSPPVTSRGANSSGWVDVPELPNANERWTVRRKATVIMAVRGGWVPIEEICRLYNLSVEEFLAWKRDMDRNGVHSTALLTPGWRTALAGNRGAQIQLSCQCLLRQLPDCFSRLEFSKLIDG